MAHIDIDLDDDFTDKIPMGDLKVGVPRPYNVTGFEEKPWGPTLLLEGNKHVELKPAALKAFARAWGRDTDSWVGKTAHVELRKFDKGTGRIVTPAPDDTAAGGDGVPF